MNESVRSIIRPEFYNSLVEIAKDDPVFQQVLDKSDTVENCMNALVAGLILVADREKYFQNTLAEMLKANPKIKQILERKNDTSMLSQGTSIRKN